MTLPNGPINCNFSGAELLFFSENVTPLVYYSHFLVLVVAAIVAFCVLLVGRKELANRILFFTLLFFFFWVFLDSVFWASNSSDVIMFVWSLTILFEPLVFLGIFYLLYVLVKKSDAPLQKKLLFLTAYAPVLALAGTKYSLPGFDQSSCLSVEGPLAIYYTYTLELAYIVSLIIFSIREYRSSHTKIQKKQILYLSIGMIFFLIAFSWGNVVSSFTENWNFAQIGLFSLPVFIGFLGYSIVRYQTFNIKLAGSILLVGALWIAELALIFLQQGAVSRNVTIITFLFTTVAGVLLIRGVGNEVRRREEITRLADSLDHTNNRLKTANEKLKELDELKTEFLSIASHQLRTPLSIIKGYDELLSDGAYGKPTKKMQEIFGHIDETNERLIKLVDDFLDVTRIEQGRTTYVFALADLQQLVGGIAKELKKTAEEKGLTLSWSAGQELVFPFDEEKIRHVISNFIDNAMKYTANGSVRITVTSNDGEAQVHVEDSGIGFGKKDGENFFQKFYRGENVRDVKVGGTGLGLYVCRKFVEAHGGRVWAKSRGVGKGSDFGFALPMDRKNASV